MARDESTYGGISRKFDQWTRNEKVRAPREHLRRVDPAIPYSPQGSSDMNRNVHAAIGFGIGALLILLAAYAFYTAGYWGSYGRTGASTGYTLVGVFLSIAGFGGIAATWNHNFRVLVRPPESHH